MLQNAEMSNEVVENKYQKMRIKELKKKEVCYFMPHLQLLETTPNMPGKPISLACRLRALFWNNLGAHTYVRGTVRLYILVNFS